MAMAARAARAALGPVAARAKGEQLLEAAMEAWGNASSGEAAKPFVADALRLISEGADLDCVDRSGRSPLMCASRREALDGIAARLIAAGAKLDLFDKGGHSALINACVCKRSATALLLVEAGAALNLVNVDGKSALDWADERGLAGVSSAIRARGGRTAAELAAAGQ
jgi:ankyrin repeat protein